MVTSRLVVFGCSFAAGHGLDDLWDPINKCCINGISQYSWPNRLANKLQLPVVNNGIPGSSNKEISFLASTFDYQPGDLVLTNWTFLQRSCILGRRTKSNMHFHLSSRSNDKINKNWQRYHMTDADMAFESTSAYIMVNALLAQNNVNHYNLYIPNQSLWEDIIKYENSIPAALDWINDHTGADGSHPSAPTYNRYADEIYDWLITHEETINIGK